MKNLGGGKCTIKINHTSSSTTTFCNFFKKEKKTAEKEGGGEYPEEREEEIRKIPRREKIIKGWVAGERGRGVRVSK